MSMPQKPLSVRCTPKKNVNYRSGTTFPTKARSSYRRFSVWSRSPLRPAPRAGNLARSSGALTAKESSFSLWKAAAQSRTLARKFSIPAMTKRRNEWLCAMPLKNGASVWHWKKAVSLFNRGGRLNGQRQNCPNAKKGFHDDALLNLDEVSLDKLAFIGKHKFSLLLNLASG